MRVRTRFFLILVPCLDTLFQHPISRGWEYARPALVPMLVSELYSKL